MTREWGIKKCSATLEPVETCLSNPLHQCADKRCIALASNKNLLAFYLPSSSLYTVHFILHTFGTSERVLYRWVFTVYRQLPMVRTAKMHRRPLLQDRFSTIFACSKGVWHTSIRPWTSWKLKTSKMFPACETDPVIAFEFYGDFLLADLIGC